jgi:hypothetical protein
MKLMNKDAKKNKIAEKFKTKLGRRIKNLLIKK